MDNDLMLAVGALVISLSVFGFSYWWGSRPPIVGRTRMIPWNLVQIAGVIAVILSLVHLINLAGFATGSR
jgi:hypothetical protein